MDDASQQLPNSYHQGYCYFDVNTGKFWIDTTNIASGRMAINAAQADTATTAAYATHAIGDGAGNSIVETYGASISYNTSTNALHLNDVNGDSISSVTNLPSIINNLTSSSTTAEKNALSAKQGYLLANGSARDNTKLPLAGGTMSGDIVPDSANSRSLGTLTNYFKDIYGNTYYGGLQHSITIGSKSFNNTENINIEVADLGLAGTNMEFKGIVTNTIIDGQSTPTSLSLKNGGTLTIDNTSEGWVVIANDGKEYIWSNGKWNNLGLATDFALASHVHGNINFNGTINTSTVVPSYSVTTENNGTIIASDLSTTDVAVLNSATSTFFVTSVTQNGAGKIFVEKADLVPYVKIAGDTMIGSLVLSNTSTAANINVENGDITIGTSGDQNERKLTIITEKGNAILSSHKNSSNFELNVQATTSTNARNIIQTLNDTNNTTTISADTFQSISPEGGSATGFQIKRDTTAYGNLSISTIGTTETTGATTLRLGNDISSGAADNAQGRLFLYGSATSGHIIKSLSNATTNYSIYLQNYGDDQYLTHVGTTATVGSSYYRNVYVAENGRITEQTYDNVICNKEDAAPTLTYVMNSSASQPIQLWQTVVDQNDASVRYGLVLGTTWFGLYNSTNSTAVTRLDLNGTNQLSANLTVKKTTANDTAFIVDNTNKSHKVSLEIGGSSGNGGIYDNTNSKWVVYSTTSGSVILNGNANTATILQTTRKINGTDFNGSADITTAKWGTARNITIGSTAKSVDGSTAVSWTHAEIGATVSNTWANGTTGGPTIKTTVNGVAGTAVAIPVASTSYSGVVTTTTQRFKGRKGFGYLSFYGQDDSGAASRYPGDTYYYNNAGTKVAEAWYDCGNVTNITTGTFTWREYSPNSTANTATTGYYETYSLPTVTAGRTANAGYTILTTKNYPDSRYVLKAGDTLGTTAQFSRVGISKSWYNGRDGAIIRQTSYTGYNAIVSAKTTNGSWEIGPYSNNYLHFVYVPDTSYSGSTNTGIVSTIRMGPTGTVFGAVWNDYAEYRKDNAKEKDIQIPGKCVHEVGDGTLALTTKRLERGCEIISDTFGFAIGQDEENGYNTPIASNGRVLAYPYESIKEFASHIGYPVCSGPDGTVSIMTEEEEEKYPSRIIGTISEIPDYEEWGTGKVKVNERVWIRIR